MATLIKLDEKSKVALICNGAGLGMALLDLFRFNKLEPAMWIDTGGGISKQEMLELLPLSEAPEILAIAIYAGINHCDVIANAILALSDEIERLELLYPHFVVLLKGTKAEEGKEILAGDSNVAFVEDYAQLISECQKRLAQ